jgi:hypothetical protein
MAIVVERFFVFHTQIFHKVRAQGFVKVVRENRPLISYR